MSNRNPFDGGWTLHIVKSGGDWDYQIRTVKPHNVVGLGIHIATVNGHLYPFVGRVCATIAAAPEMHSSLIEAVSRVDDLVNALGKSCIAVEDLAAWSDDAKDLLDRIKEGSKE